MSASTVAAAAPAAVQSAHTHLVKTLYRQVIKLQLNWVVDRSGYNNAHTSTSETPMHNMHASYPCIPSVVFAFQRALAHCVFVFATFCNPFDTSSRYALDDPRINPSTHRTYTFSSLSVTSGVAKPWRLVVSSRPRNR